MIDDEIKIADLQNLQSDEGFAAIDLEFADFICRQAKNRKYELFAAAAIASYAVRNGNPCAELKNYGGRKFPPFGKTQTQYALPEVKTWLQILTMISAPPVLEFYSGKGKSQSYLIIDLGDHLYFNRFFSYEQQVCNQILQRCAFQHPQGIGSFKLENISKLFKENEKGVVDYQQLAVFTALANKFSIITGGPGTGKTTVASVLLALKAIIWNQDWEMNITLCAPTGKAQARLKEAVFNGVEELNVPAEIKEKLKKCHCSTIHRLLGYKHHSTQFKHNENNPLTADLLVVDEVSMISLPLMAKLLAALKPGAEMVLLGDKDQLSSVDAGSVLADLYQSGKSNVLPPDLGAVFENQTGMNIQQITDKLPLSGCIAKLQVNHRADGPMIKRIAADIRQLDDGKIAELGKKIANLKEADFYTRGNGENFHRDFETEIKSRSILVNQNKKTLMNLPKLAECGDMLSLETAFDIVENFKVLCAIRHGDRGVDELNQQILKLLNIEEFAPGVPVMITQNQLAKELYNGDVGIVWNTGGKKRFYFRDWEKGGFRSFLPAEIHGYEMTFAMTIHKSQGSGFQNVVIVLPETENPLLTRELLYTAVTRAKKNVILFGSEEIINHSLQQRTIRQSGLFERLMRQHQQLD